MDTLTQHPLNIYSIGLVQYKIEFELSIVNQFQLLKVDDTVILLRNTLVGLFSTHSKCFFNSLLLVIC